MFVSDTVAICTRKQSVTEYAIGVWVKRRNRKQNRQILPILLRRIKRKIAVAATIIPQSKSPETAIRIKFAPSNLKKTDPSRNRGRRKFCRLRLLLLRRRRLGGDPSPWTTLSGGLDRRRFRTERGSNGRWFLGTRWEGTNFWTRFPAEIFYTDHIISCPLFCCCCSLSFFLFTELQKISGN